MSRGKTKADLELEIAELKAQLAGSGKAPARAQPRSTSQARPRASAASTRSAALSRAAPTVRMRVDERAAQPQPRRPGSADILAVGIAAILSILAVAASGHDPTRGDHDLGLPHISAAHH